MKADACGFKYPEVDLSKCTDCGLCEKVCVFHEDYSVSENFSEPLAFAVRHKDYEEIRTSRSGAMFIALSDFIFSQGGVVYGAGYEEGFRVAHKRVASKLACKELKGSKYVQSDLTDVFAQVKEDLQKHIPVLFSGTPCQTAGLRSFIGKRNREYLYLCDIVCHGTPSPLFWKDYLRYWEKKRNGKIVETNFRDKVKGWSSHIESYVFQDGKKIFTDEFTYLFYKHILFRPSCGNCQYTNFHRPSDITIADFWGWQKVDSRFNEDNMGCSLVLVNTEKGKRLFEEVRSNLNVLRSDLASCLQPNLQDPSQLSPDYAQFWNEYDSDRIDFLMKKYGNAGLVFRMKRGLKRVIKKVIGR